MSTCCNSKRVSESSDTEWLVQQQHLRRESERARDADALPHALRKLGGLFVHRITQADHGEVILNDLRGARFCSP